MGNRINTLVTFCVFMVFLILSSGCANYQAVRTYAEESKKLSEASNPIISDVKTICLEKYKRKKMLAAEKYDPKTIEQEANELCKPIDDQNSVIIDLNGVLANYAEILAALADDKLPIYKTELDKLKGSLSKVQIPSGENGAMEAAFDNKKISAISSFLAFLGSGITKHKQKEAVRQLLEKDKEIVIITTALRDYVIHNYKGWSNDELRELEVLKKKLVQDEEVEPLAARYLNYSLFEVSQRIDQRNETVTKYLEALGKLQSTHVELMSKWETPEDKELLKQMTTLANEVYQLQKLLQDAF